MHFTPKDQEKLMLHMAGELAGERGRRGLRLNYVEAVSFLASGLLEYARDGKTVAELMELGRKMLSTEDVMEGVADMVSEVRRMKPGAMVIADREIVLNEGKETRELLVANVGDRPVQVGSHYHFFEVNRLLTFDREPAFGFRLDIPSGTSVRFEPGEEKTVRLVELGGRKIVYGCNDLTRGEAVPDNREAAMEKAAEKGMLSPKGGVL